VRIKPSADASRQRRLSGRGGSGVADATHRYVGKRSPGLERPG